MVAVETKTQYCVKFCQKEKPKEVYTSVMWSFNSLKALKKCAKESNEDYPDNNYWVESREVTFSESKKVED